MRNGVRIKTQFFDGFTRFAIVGCVGRIRQEEFCFALRGVPLDRRYDCRTNQDPIFSLFRCDQSAFFNSKTFAQFGGNDDGAAFTDFGRFNHLCLNVRISEIRAKIKSLNERLNSFNKHAIAVREKPVTLFDGVLVRLQNIVPARKS
jgi:hypothetical protein